MIESLLNKSKNSINYLNYTASKFNDVNRELLNFFLPDGLCGVQSVLMVCFKLNIEIDISDFLYFADKLKKMDSRCAEGYSIIDIYYAVSKITDIEFEMYFDFNNFVKLANKQYEKSIEYLNKIGFQEKFKEPISFEDILSKVKDKELYPIFAFKCDKNKEGHFSPFDFMGRNEMLHFGCPEIENDKPIQCDIDKKTFLGKCWTLEKDFGNCLIFWKKMK